MDMSTEEFIAAVEKWGRGRQANGYRSRQAHTHDTDTGAGLAALGSESQSDAERLAWAVPLVKQIETGTLERQQVDGLVMAIDQWGFDRWMTGWQGDLTAESDKGRPWVNMARDIL